MDHLTALPNELILETSRYLWPSELVILLRVCKHLHGLFEDVLWSEIEGHRPGTHEEVRLGVRGEWEDRVDPWEGEWLGEADIVGRPDPSAPYQFTKLESRWTCRRQYAKRSDQERFFTVIDTLPLDRWQTLANKIRSLCMTAENWSDLHWQRITECVNLRNLELIGKPDSRGWGFTISAPPMAKLQNLRLRGYIPPQLVQHVCGYGTTLTHLNLGILEDPGREYPIDHGDGVKMTRVEYAKHFFSWTSHGFTPYLPHLTHLHLCKPMSETESGDRNHVADFWEPHDDIVHEEWADLLRTVSSTLTVLVLEHRTFLLCFENADFEREEFINNYFDNDRSNGRLREKILPLLLEGRSQFPSLTEINFRGINISPETTAQLTEKFPAAKLTCISFAYPFWIDFFGCLMQDNCDGLMWTDKLEYMRLYGPTWRPK